MLISFNNDEAIKIGRGVLQRQEAIQGLLDYLERAIPATAMNAVNTSGDHSEKFKGFAMCLAMLRDEIVQSGERAEQITKNDAMRHYETPGHVQIS